MILNKSKIEQTKQLGMPIGTAYARLKKSVMFSLLQQLNQDICYRCNKKIETSEELSIDHIKPWLYNNIKLFWDLNNISFSHVKCNKPLRGHIKALYKIAPKGKVWCSGCKKYKIQNQFTKNKSEETGFSCYCKKCRKKRNWK